MANDFLQVVGVGDDGQLWHTIRNADGTWTPGFGLIESVSVGGPWKFNMVGCAGTEGGPFLGSIILYHKGAPQTRPRNTQIPSS